MKHDHPILTRRWAIAATLMAYAAYLLIYFPARRFLGEAVAALSGIPALLVAGLFGLRVGSVAALLTIAVDIGLQMIALQGTLPPFRGAQIMGYIMLLVSTMAAGYLYDVRQQTRRDLLKRQFIEAALRESEQQFVRMFDQSPIGAAIVSLQARILRANESMGRILGFSVAELTTLTVADITYPEDLLADEEQFKKLVAGEIDQYQLDKRYVCKNGRVIWGHLSVGMIKNAAGEPLYCLPMVEDITERKNAEAAFAREAAFNSAMADLARALITETSIDEISHLFLEYATRLTDSPLGIITYLDSARDDLVSLVMEFDPDGNPSSPPVDTCAAAQDLTRRLRESSHALLSNDLASEEGFYYLQEIWPSLHRIILSPAILDERIIGHIGLANAGHAYTDDDLLLSERLAAVYAVAIHQMQLEEKYRYMSMHDALTGLYNRAYFEEELGRLKSSRHLPISVIVCDLDGLKETNDCFGHTVGDDLLRGAASTLQASFRPEDVIARIGGDEFAVILPGVTAAVADAALERIRNNLAAYKDKNPGAALSLSLGAATTVADSTILDVFKLADAAMYAEKVEKRRCSAQEDGC